MVSVLFESKNFTALQRASFLLPKLLRVDGRMGKPSQVIAVVEDQRQKNFVLRYLQRLGYPIHAIRFELSPRGKGAAEQWVREQYVKNVQAYRFRAARAETALIIMIDADRSEVQQR